MNITKDQREVIFYKVKEMLEIEDVKVILDEQTKIVSTPINNTTIAIKKNVKILLIISNNDTIKYDEEAIAKILAK